MKHIKAAQIIQAGGKKKQREEVKSNKMHVKITNYNGSQSSDSLLAYYNERLCRLALFSFVHSSEWQSTVKCHDLCLLKTQGKFSFAKVKIIEVRRSERKGVRHVIFFSLSVGCEAGLPSDPRGYFGFVSHSWCVTHFPPSCLLTGEIKGNTSIMTKEGF